MNLTRPCSTNFTRIGRAGRVAALGSLLVALVGFSTAGVAAEVKSPLVREYDLKAVFVFNFSQFVDWPATAFSDKTAPFVIGVLGEDPFGQSLDEVVANGTVQERKMVARRCRTLDEVAACQIVFVSRSEAKRLKDILSFLTGKSILTVGDSDGFAKRGGMIALVVEHDRLQLEINAAMAKSAQLTISSKLLRQAEIVGANP
jgi:uncharacterized protein DUF4154